MSVTFIRAIRDAGIPIDDGIVADGYLHRVHVDGDKAGTKNAWYVLHSGDFPAGAFGCNKRGISGKWRANGKREPLTQQARSHIDADRKARAVAQERGYSDAAERAERIFQQATRDASEHAYVVRKGVQPHGVKMNEHGLLVVPIFSAFTGKLQSLQFISGDGSKRMLKGGRVSGGCYPFSDVPNFGQTQSGKLDWAKGSLLAQRWPNPCIPSPCLPRFLQAIWGVSQQPCERISPMQKSRSTVTTTPTV